MRKGFLLLGVIALAITLLPAAPRVEAQRQPTVLAYFYGWFNTDQWNDPNLVDRPAEPYNSADGGVMARQISQAQSAGIDGFVMSWFARTSRTRPASSTACSTRRQRMASARRWMWIWARASSARRSRR